MKADDFSKLVELFFVEHLSKQRNLSAHTIAGYRDTFHLLLRFLSIRLRKLIDALSLEALAPTAVLAFLEYLVTERKNSAQTRNQRLAALRSFARFVVSRAPTVFFATGRSDGVCLLHVRTAADSVTGNRQTPSATPPASSIAWISCYTCFSAGGFGDHYGHG